MKSTLKLIRSQRSIAFFILTALVPPVAATAQDASGLQPAADGYLQAMKAGNWIGVANRTHPEALREMRELIESVASVDQTGELLSTFYGGRASDFAELSDEEVFAGFIGFVMTQDPSLGAVMASAEQEVLGHVMEGDTAHVVTRVRVEAEGIPVTQMEVSSFQPHEGEWKAMLRGEVKGVAAALRAMVGGG